VRVLAIDIGTTSAKAALLDDGVVVSVAEAPVDLVHPQPGWAEQDPEQWWSSAVAAVRSLGRVGDVSVLAVTGQMQDCVPISLATGRSVRPAILYSDQRAAAQHEALAHRLGSAWADASLAQPDATNVAAKWQWVRDNEPQHAAATDVVLLGGAAYIVWRATGVASSDATTAATTGLAEVRANAWWSPVVDAVSAPVPLLAGATQVVGHLTPGAAAELGLPNGLPVVHAPGDAVSTSIGVLGDEVDVPYAYLGTSGWVGVFRPAPEPRDGVIVLPGATADRWLSVMPVATAGAAVDWARESLLGGIDFETLDRLAAGVCAASEGVGFVSQLDGTRFPTPDPHATGVLIGMRRSTSRAVIAAAVYEGVAHLLAAVAEAVIPDATGTSHDLAVAELTVCGGGARSDVWCQIIADVTGRVVRRVSDEHASLRGAASCAHRALGQVPLAGAATLAAFSPRPEHRGAHLAMGQILSRLSTGLRTEFAALAEARAGQPQI